MRVRIGEGAVDQDAVTGIGHMRERAIPLIPGTSHGALDQSWPGFRQGACRGCPSQGTSPAPRHIKGREPNPL